LGGQPTYLGVIGSLGQTPALVDPAAENDSNSDSDLDSSNVLEPNLVSINTNFWSYFST
jgi:hypothetical protein